MAIRLVIFDMAGTTVYDDDNVNSCLKEALAESGIQVSRDEVNAVMGIEKPLAIRILMEKKLPSDEISDKKNETIYQLFLKKMIHHYEFSKDVREIEGAREVFKALHSKGIKVGLDTGFARQIANVITSKLGWHQGIDYDVLSASDDVANGRPHADLVLRAMKLTGVTDVKQVVKVGDTPADLGEGHAAGCALNIGVLSGACTREELEIHPHTHLVASIKDVIALV
jgi:phosphonatase-like hydrolase